MGAPARRVEPTPDAGRPTLRLVRREDAVRVGTGSGGQQPRPWPRWLVVLVVGLAGVLLAFALGVDTGPRTTGAPATPTPAGNAVVVGPGDTLWDVAVRHAPPGGDPRATLAEIAARNGIDTGRPLPAWTVIELPP